MPALVMCGDEKESPGLLRHGSAAVAAALPTARLVERRGLGHAGPASYFPSIEKKYGKSVSYRLDLINSSPLTKHKALVDWLKADYGIGHGHATALVGYARGARPTTTP
jgi:hypothetical protein